MRASKRAGLALVFGCFGIALVSASVAFACSPAAYIQSGGVTAGPPGTRVPLTADAFRDTGETYGQVAIRWNSLTGTQIGSAAGPSFSVQVEVPNAAPGFYYIVAVQRRLADNAVEGRSSVAFEVTGSTASPPPSPTSNPSPPSTTTEQPTTQSAPPAASTPTPAPSPDSAPAASAPPEGAASPAVSAPGASAPATASSPSDPLASTSSGATGAVTSGASAPSRSGSAAPAANRGDTGASAQPTASEATQASGGAEPPVTAPDAAATTPTGDTNLSPATPSTSGAKTEASLSSLDTPSASGSPSYAVGAGLLSAGLLAVFASFFVAAVRKRKVLAQ